MDEIDDENIEDADKDTLEDDDEEEVLLLLLVSGTGDFKVFIIMVDQENLLPMLLRLLNLLFVLLGVGDNSIVIDLDIDEMLPDDRRCVVVVGIMF